MRLNRNRIITTKHSNKIVKFLCCTEQLEKIEGGMDSINADMQIAEKALKGMELCCGIFPKFWKK